MAGRAGDADGREEPLRIVGRPLQNLHAAHGPADHGEQGLDAEVIDQHGLGPHHVGDGDDRKGQTPGLAGPGVNGGGARRAHAAADHIGADDEMPLGIQRQTRTHHLGPPTGLAVGRMQSRHMLVAGERVTH